MQPTRLGLGRRDDSRSRSRGLRGPAAAAAAGVLLSCTPVLSGCEPHAAVVRIGLAGSGEHLPAPRFVVASASPDQSLPNYARVVVERFPRSQGDAGPLTFQPVWRLDDIPVDAPPPHELRYGQVLPGAHITEKPVPLRACERYVLSVGGPGVTSDGGAFQVEPDGTVLPLGARTACPL